MHVKQLLEELTHEKAPGPSSSFSDVHVIKAVELIAEKPIGRVKLSKALALGAGATRTLIERLKNLGLVAVNRTGCVLTERGNLLWSRLHTNLPRKAFLERTGLTLAASNVALLVKGCGSKVGFGIGQRDAAMMAGAKGATSLIFRNGRLLVPPDLRSVAEDFPKIHRRLVDSLKPEENDAVVIGSADTSIKAEYGALAAALATINNTAKT